MELSDRIEHQWTIINHISSYIQSADSKAASGLAVLGIILGFLLNNKLFPIKELLTAYKLTALSLITILVFCIWVALVILAMYYALLCLVSRTGMKKVLRVLEPDIKRSTSTTVYFGQISMLDSTEYQSRVLAQDENEVLADLIMQTHTLSEIATEKYAWLSSCYIFTGAVLIIALFMMGISVFI